MIFNYSGSGSIRPGVNKYSTTFDQTVGYKFDVSISATASISSFDKTSQSLDFSNSKNNSSASFPTTFDAGYKLPVTFDTQDQIIVSNGNKSVTYSTSGSGTIIIFAEKVEKVIDPYIGSGSITLGKYVFVDCSSSQIDANITSLTVDHRFGSYYRTANKANIRESVTPPTTSQLFTISSAEVEKNTESYAGSGSIIPGRSYLPAQTFDETSSSFDLNGNTLPVVAPTFDKNYINFAKFNVDTLSPLTFDNGLINQYGFSASKTQSIPNHALEKFVTNPPEDLVLFNISGSYNNLQAVNSWRGSGSIAISGTNSDFKLTDSYFGSGPITLSSAKVEKNRESYVGSGSIVPGRSYLPPTSQTFDQNSPLFDLDSNKLPVVATTFDKDYINFAKFNVATLTPLTFDNGLLNPYAFGATQTQSIPNHALESFVVNPPEDLVLFNISGAYNNLQAVNSWRGSGSIIVSGELVHPKIDFTPHYGIEQNIGIGTYAFTVSGSAKESFIAQTPENNQLFSIGVRKLPAVGFGGNPELYTTFDKDNFLFQQYQRPSIIPPRFDSAVVNPGVLGTDQFIFNTGNESISYARYTGSTVTLNISAAYNNLQAVNSWRGSGSIAISGTPLVHPQVDLTPHYGIEQNIGIGTYAFTVSGSAKESFIAQTPENNQLFRIGVSKIPPVPVLQTFDQTQSVFDIDGNKLPTYVSFDKDYLNFAKFNVATVSPLTFDNTLRNPASVDAQVQYIPNHALESFIANPPEDLVLFNINGTCVEKFAPNPPENVELFNISGSCTIKSTDVYLGSGFGSATFSGAYTNLKATDSYFGSGSIIISASQVEKNTESYVGSGSIIISASQVEKNTESYVGSGSVTFSGTCVEKFAPNPLENVELFNISGSKVESIRDSYVGVGTITISAAQVEKNTESYVGSGSIISGRSYLPPIKQTFDQTGPLFDLDSNKIPVVAPTFDKDYINFAKFNVDTLSPLTFDNGLISPYAFGATQTQSIPNYALVSATINNPTSGVITISAAEILRSTNSYVGVGTIIITGTVGQVYGPNPPENVELFNISGSKVERIVDSYVGSGSTTFSGAYTNLKFRDSYVGSGSIVISAAQVEKVRDSYVGVGTIRISGNLNESYTKRGYQGSGGVIFSASKAESKTNVVEASTITPIRLRGELIFPQVRYIPSIPSVGVITAYGDILKVRATVVERGSGSLRLNDDAGLTVTTPVLPVSSRGGIFVGGNGKQSFSRSTYVGIGVARFSGISKTRTFAVYTGIGSGQITVSQQTKVIGKKLTKSYRGTGSITLYSAKVEKNTESYNGLGRVNVSGTAINKFAPNPPENAQLFNLYGRGAEAFVKSKYIGIGTATFSSTLVERKSKSYSGSGSVGISGTFSIVTTRTFQSIGNGLLRFKKYVSDDIYGTCDSLDITCDYQDTGYVKFISNPPESIQIFTVYGSANTRKSSRYTYSGSGRITISGSVATKKSKSISGSGNVVFSSRSTNKDVHAYKAIGSIAVLSGSAKSLTKKPISSTVLYTVSGIASTKINHIIRVSGIGTGYFNGSANTKVLSRPSYSGTGSITLSGQLVHPNIKFLPRPKGSGCISIVGSADKKFVHKYTRTSGTLFAFSGGRESYGRKGYIGIGTIRVQSTIGITVNNPYQIPRTYVWII